MNSYRKVVTAERWIRQHGNGQNEQIASTVHWILTNVHHGHVFVPELYSSKRFSNLIPGATSNNLHSVWHIHGIGEQTICAESRPDRTAGTR